MEIIDTVVTKVWEVYSGPFLDGNGFNWLFVGAAALIALLVFWFRDGNKNKRSPLAFFKYLIPRRLYLHNSARLDYKFALVELWVSGLAASPFLLSILLTLSVTENVWAFLRFSFGDPGPQFTTGLGWEVMLTIAVVLASDIALYWAHYSLHRVGFLWEFHKVHHSAQVLTPITVFRAHPIEGMLSAFAQGVLTGIVFGVFDYLVVEEVSQTRIIGTNVIVLLFLLTAGHLRHSHIWLSYGRVLNRIFISPAHHQIHHSLAERHLDKNFGQIFSFWDVLFGSHYAPDQREELALGLHNVEEQRQYSSVWNLYWLPFRKAFGRLRAHEQTGNRRPT